MQNLGLDRLLLRILKIDNEGEEINTISSIDTSFWKFIKCVNVDGDNVRKYVPSDFKSDKNVLNVDAVKYKKKRKTKPTQQQEATYHR